MKVCPLCEFIYEDDQSLCDMDGAELVYDPAPLALAQVGAPEAAPRLAKSRWKRLAVAAVAGVVLGTVPVLVFHVFSLRSQEQHLTSAPLNSNYSSPPVIGDSEVPLNPDLALPVPLTPSVDALPTPASSAWPESPSRQSTHLAEPSAKATGNISPLVKRSPATAPAPAPRHEERDRRAVRANPKPMELNHKESGFGSFLKKTGRILKKPFRF